MKPSDWEAYDQPVENAIPMERWGHDHWSTFAYLETVTVDREGMVSNERMRCNSRLHRGLVYVGPSGVVEGAQYPTRLKDGEIDRHDDWSCLEDMVALGLVRAWVGIAKRGEIFGHLRACVELTTTGQEIAAQLRRHKAAGGNFRDFEPVAVAAMIR